MSLPDYLRFREGFAQALDERFYPLAHLDSLVTSGRALLWTSEGAAAIAELRAYPSGLVDLHWLCATGELAELTGVVLPAAEAWAKANGCAGSVVESREGWARALRPHGYEVHQLAVRKAL